MTKTGSVRTVAVLGAGHGGCAAAADLTARGFDVRLHARREATLETTAPTYTFRTTKVTIAPLSRSTRRWRASGTTWNTSRATVDGGPQ